MEILRLLRHRVSKGRAELNRGVPLLKAGMFYYMTLPGDCLLSRLLKEKNTQVTMG